jgi:assimilatory nitrate reductase catalytic subunit
MPVRPSPPAEPLNGRYPLSLNTGRIRDQWHTMTRTGLAPGLARHIPEPFVEIHPADAAALGIADGRLACIETARGEAVALARVTDRQRRGSLFMPMHWTDAFAPSGRANPLVADAVDPTSGQPEFKHTPARIFGYRETWAGFCLAREPAARPKGADVIWRRIPHTGAHLHEFAGRGDADEREIVRRTLVGCASGERLQFEDATTGVVREAWIAEGRLTHVLYFGHRLPPRGWLADAFSAPHMTDETRRWLLHGRVPGFEADASPLVCACASVSAQEIGAAITAGACSLAAIGKVTRAGETCGSCRPEIARMLTVHQKESRDAA